MKRPRSLAAALLPLPTTACGATDTTSTVSARPAPGGSRAGWR
ncbi:hypothetical protein [Streptomyces sp. NPDC005435]